MGRTLVIAEVGSSWDCDLSKAFRLIDAAKACDASAAKFQWTSNAKAMAERRLGSNAVQATQMYKRYLEYPKDVLMRLKAHCDSVGIEFMCTVYLIEDIATIAPLVKRFKVSAYESKWDEFVKAHYPLDRPIVLSSNDPDTFKTDYGNPDVSILWCVSKYPTPIEDLHLSNMKAPRHGMLFQRFDGLSDHTTSTLTGALAVAAGASIVEKHIRLHDTDPSNPDFGHSLAVDQNSTATYEGMIPPFGEYVRNIREAERAL